MIPDEHLWMIIVGFIIAFVLAFGIGANDVANSFGTSVGAKVLTLRQACILATIFEIAGAVLIGYRVSDTIRKGIIDVSSYNETQELLMVGYISSLSGSCVWLILATFLKLPVSGTHTIVGATIGFALVAQGASGVHWKKFGMIIASWFISPLLSGLATCIVFQFSWYFVLKKPKPLENGLRILPLFYAFTIFVNFFSIFYDGSNLLGFDKIPIWGVIILCGGSSVIVALIIKFGVNPWMKKKIEEECLARSADDNSSSDKKDISVFISDDADVAETALSHPSELNSVGESGSCNNVIENGGVEKQMSFISTRTEDALLPDSPDEEKGPSGDSNDLIQARAKLIDKPETARLFSFLQILTAVFGSFAHGGNDVSNAIAPCVGLWIISETRSVMQQAATPIWILFYGGVGISLGLWVWGRRVIKTLGEDLTKITPSSGFSIEIGAALTVLIASNIGIPISTTHCKVGSVVGVGRLRSRENVDWSLFRNIIFAWLVTLPVAGGISAAIMFGLKHVVPN